MSEKDKDNAEGLAMFVALGVLFFIVVHWLFYTNLISRDFIYDSETNSVSNWFKKLNAFIIPLKFVFAISIAASVWVKPSTTIAKKYNKSDKRYYMYMTIFFILVWLIPYFRINIVDILLMPILLIGLVFYSSIYFGIIKQGLVDDDSIFGITNKEKDDLSLSLPIVLKQDVKFLFWNWVKTYDDEITIHKPNQAIGINGGTGSGKTILGQWVLKGLVEKGYCGVMYDFEGDVREWVDGSKENPLVNTRTVLAILRDSWDRIGEDGLTTYTYPVTNDKGKEYLKTIREKPVRFGLINFISPKHSVRVNPLNRNYVNNITNLRSIITIFLKAVDLELVKKTDFWAKNGISYTQAIAIRLWKSFPELLTIPHIISFLLSDYNLVLEWLADDPETEKQAATIMTSYNAGAESQLAGSTASGQAPVQQLYDANLYYTLSPPEGEEFDLDITNKENPYILSVSNVPEMSDAFSPMISVILNICMRNMNKLNNRKSLWFSDEFPTITMNPDEIGKFIATARKKLVTLVTMTQSNKQEEDKYGKEKSLILRDNKSNVFQGKTTSSETANELAKDLGKVQKVKKSVTTSSSGVSVSESLAYEDVIQARDIKGQSIGNFIGQVADGDPPYFNLQFKNFDQSQIAQDIPIMNDTVDTGDPKMDDLVWEEIVKENFIRVNKEVFDVLAVYKQIEEE